jgi:hypothetical protein
VRWKTVCRAHTFRFCIQHFFLLARSVPSSCHPPCRVRGRSHGDCCALGSRDVCCLASHLCDGKQSAALTLFGFGSSSSSFWPDPCLHHAIRLASCGGGHTAIAAQSGVGRALLNLRQSLINMVRSSDGTNRIMAPTSNKRIADSSVTAPSISGPRQRRTRRHCRD